MGAMPDHQAPPIFDEKTVQAIADAAEADARSVWKRLAGGEVRGRVAARIDREIASRLAGAGRAGPEAAGPHSAGKVVATPAETEAPDGTVSRANP